MQEYFEAFVAMGGKLEEFTPLGITVDYEAKHISPQYASFILRQYETTFSAYNHYFYYSLDLETGWQLALQDWLGNDYRQIAAQNIEGPSRAEARNSASCRGMACPPSASFPRTRIFT